MAYHLSRMPGPYGTLYPQPAMTKDTSTATGDGIGCGADWLRIQLVFMAVGVVVRQYLVSGCFLLMAG